MDACLNVLSEQFPDLPEPQTALLSQLLKPGQDKSCGHWALSHLSNGIIFLFDSLLPKKLDVRLREQMLSLYGNRQVQRPCVQHQNGSKDCGCFAIAFCVTLLYGADASSLMYTQKEMPEGCQKEMRAHVISCLKQNKFLPFPSKDYSPSSTLS